jgi:multiple sugar transport system substrate-binding protein
VLGPATTRAGEIMSKLANSKAADPSLASQKEDQNRLAFEQGTAAFQVNYPFIYPSAKTDNPKLFKQIGWAPYPRTDASKPERAPIGGINWGVAGSTQHPTEAFEAAACLRNRKNQLIAANKGGLPPTIAAIYDSPAFVKQYPFAALIRREVATGAARPQTPAYADVSLAIAKAVSPPTKIQPKTLLSTLKGQLKDALNSGVLL